MQQKQDSLQMYIEITRITIILCWLSLITFWCIKLLGGNWFEIAVGNENFVAFSNFIENSDWKYLVSFLTIFVANYFLFGAITQQFNFKGKQVLVLFALTIIQWAVINFSNIEFLQFSIGYVVYLVVGIIYQRRYKKLLGLMTIILTFLFSTISILTRNIELHILPYMLSILVSIDIYLMTILYYLYYNLVRLNGNMAFIFGSGWLSTEEAKSKGYGAWKRFWHNVWYIVSFKWLKKKPKV